MGKKLAKGGGLPQNIAQVSRYTTPRSYRWGHTSEIEAGADFGVDSAYHGRNQALGGDTSCFINEDWSLPQRMDKDQ